LIRCQKVAIDSFLLVSRMEWSYCT